MIEYLERLVGEHVKHRDKLAEARRHHVERSHARTEHLLERRRGTPPRVVRRTEEIRTRINPRAFLVLEDLRRSRMCDKMPFAASILEGVSELWEKHKYDHALFLARCEDPSDAEVVIDPNSDKPPFYASSDDQVWNMLVSALVDLRARGFSEQGLVDTVVAILEVVDG